jgi:hypothetical protein
LDPNSVGFVREGFSFDGWRLHTTDIDKIISDGFIPAGLSPKDGAAIFIAMWVENNYIVSFFPDYPGAVSPLARTVKYGSTIEGLNEITNSLDIAFIPNVSPTYGSLTFLGWRTAEMGKGELITAETPWMFAFDRILYGFWGQIGGGSTQPVVKLKAHFSSIVIDTNAAGPVAGDTEFPKGGVLKFTLADLNKFDAYDFVSIKIGTTTIEKTGFNVAGEAFSSPLNFNVNVVVYYKLKSTPIEPEPTTYTATFSSKIAATNANGPALNTATLSYQAGSKLNLPIGMFDAKANHTFLYIKVGETKIEPAAFNQTVNGKTGYYVSGALYANISVVAYYSVNQVTPTDPDPDPTPATYTATFSSKIAATNASGPALGTSTLSYQSGSKLNLPIGMFESKTGYDFLYIKVGATQAAPAAFNQTVNGKTGYYVTTALTSNVSIVAYYAVKAPVVTNVTLSMVYTTSNGKAVPSFLQAADNREIKVGEEQRFWLYNVTAGTLDYGTVGFDTFGNYNLTFDYFLVNGTKYYKSNLTKSGTNYYLSMTFTANTTFTVVYK